MLFPEIKENMRGTFERKLYLTSIDQLAHQLTAQYLSKVLSLHYFHKLT